MAVKFECLKPFGKWKKMISLLNEINHTHESPAFLSNEKKKNVPVLMVRL